MRLRDLGRLALPALAREGQWGLRLSPNPIHRSFLPGRHALEIARHFGGRTSYDGEGPIQPLPLYVLAFTNRCGSQLLSGYLREQPGLKGFGEVLNHGVVASLAAKAQVTTFPGYVGWLAAQGGKARAALGVKAAADQLEMLLRWRIDRMFPALRVIHLHRLDEVAQAISLRLALQTQQWTSRLSPRPDVVPTYDFDAICRALLAIRRGNDAIRLAIAARGLEVITLTYEDLVGDPDAVVGRLLGWAALPTGRPLPRPDLVRQATAVSEEFRERFMSDYRRRCGI